MSDLPSIKEYVLEEGLNCGGCSYSDTVLKMNGTKDTKDICRLKAPAVVKASIDGITTAWPEINLDKDWCGDHSELVDVF